MRDFWYTYSVKNDKPYIPSRTERNLLYLAYSLSVNLSDIKCSKHSCFILDDNDNIICTYVNTKTNNIACTGSWSIHAEEGAIQEFNKLPIKPPPSLCKLMVVRGNLMGETSESRPCIYCYKSILESGIKEIIYTVGPEKYCRMYATDNYLKNQKKINIKI